MRLSYGERMAAEREKSEKAREEKEAHKRAMDLVFGVPSLCAHFPLFSLMEALTHPSTTAVQAATLANC
jgi:lipopolysaccharide/colanic/teichoic acid biosynthesis glycosyltransferase